MCPPIPLDDKNREVKDRIIKDRIIKDRESVYPFLVFRNKWLLKTDRRDDKRDGEERQGSETGK